MNWLPKPATNWMPYLSFSLKRNVVHGYHYLTATRSRHGKDMYCQNSECNEMSQPGLTEGTLSPINGLSPLYGDEDADQPLNRVLSFQAKYFWVSLPRAAALAMEGCAVGA
jgi:hypothetical protein